ncbi:hypothetical protein [Methanocaldococcus fervens]|uniref:Uncharacterized protein n=1 Tax=Methanocaldococcus fervens (strain DSM 4213 / JCM 15782 / AG86) TaxID=573064 RepID=C7P5T3_METFA|nr:hypothetical protein [Methanocaldococcus fervens]ACV23915.1 hypothetical protein Mefer_0073 [Methanocaldococcus fervens AG86]
MNIFRFIRKDKKSLFLMFIGTTVFIFIFIPFLKFKMIGLNHKINAYPCLSPMCGLLLGYIYGFFAIFLTVLIYFLLNPKAFYFGVYSLVPPALAVISAGALSEGKWKYSVIILALGLLIFYLTDVGREVFYHSFLSISALLIIIAFREKISEFLFNKDDKKIILGALILSFSTVMIDHLYGSILGILYLHLSADDYIRVIPTFIEERAIMTIMGAFFVVLVVEITNCFLRNATKFREKLLKSYIEEEVEMRYKDINVDEELLKKYNVRIPLKEEQKEALERIVEAMASSNYKNKL